VGLVEWLGCGGIGVKILRSDAFKQVPWRNGGGVTQEIAIYPDGAGADSWQWRISMASVTTPGPFSMFPKIDRVLTVIEGAGMELSFGGAAPSTVVIGNDPISFAGDVPCASDLKNGPIRDLNIMTRRGQWRADVRHADYFDSKNHPVHHIVFAAHGPVDGMAGEDRFTLNTKDALWLSRRETQPINLAGRWLDIQLFPAASD